jgi:hypothetical protein
MLSYSGTKTSSSGNIQGNVCKQLAYWKKKTYNSGVKYLKKNLNIIKEVTKIKPENRLLFSQEQ